MEKSAASTTPTVMKGAAAAEPPATPASDQPGANVRTSKQPATVCRDVHVYSNRWHGPQPGKIVTGPWPSVEGVKAGERQTANVNVFLDGVVNRDALAQFRHRKEGNTFAEVEVFDELSAEQRAELIAASQRNREWFVWCEWPPKV
jgi:hypothetical protein